MKRRIGLLGASSLVGQQLLSRLVEMQCQVIAYSRKIKKENMNGVEWRQLAAPYTIDQYLYQQEEGTFAQREDWNMRSVQKSQELITDWISVIPIWILSEYFPFLMAHGIRRIVAMSSTSRFTKKQSLDIEEQEVASRLIQAEDALQIWAQQHHVQWILFRPTLIYGLGQDKNIAEIARFIHRFGFFPVFGRAQGLRQPIHAIDVAQVCITALLKSGVTNCAYNISGGETLTYREMVIRVFTAMGRPVRLISVPLGVFRIVIAWLRLFPRCRHWSMAMAVRMNCDLVFDHSEALNDLAFNPRSFNLTMDEVRIGQIYR